MRSQPSALRIGAAALAVSLAGSYVWFQAAQAGAAKSKLLPGSKTGRVVVYSNPDGQATTTTAPTTNASEAADLGPLLPSSKSAAVFRPPQASPSTQPSAQP